METIQQTMKRTQRAFEAGLPQEDRKRRKIAVITLGVILLCSWALLALYIIVGGNRSSLDFAPEVVYVPKTPAPVAGSGPSFYQSSRRSVAPMTYRRSASAVSYITPAPKAQMGSTSYRVHQTSSATVHSYGGGGTGSGNTGAIIRHNSNNSGNSGGGGGVNYAALAYSGAIYVPTQRNNVTDVGADEAGDVSAQKMAVVRRAKAGGFPGQNPDPFPSEEPPVPLGDMPLAMLALLAAAYALRITRRKAEITE